MDQVKVRAGEYIRVEGPAMIEVASGKVYLLGAVYESGSRFTILRARRVVAKVLEDSVLNIVLGPQGFIDKPRPGEEVVDEWDSKLPKDIKGGLIVILGGMDSGKTTVTTMLANKASLMNMKVGVIDADPGQNDIGPPASISCSILLGSRITHLSQLSPIRQVFLGYTSLEGNWQRAVEAIRKLVDYLRNAEKADVILVNTDGWVDGEEAVKYKLTLVKALEPTHVIVMRKGGEVDEIIKGASGLNVIVLNAPPILRVRNRSDRKVHRDMGYGRYLSPSRDVTFNMSEVPIVNMPISPSPLDPRVAKLILNYLRVRAQAVSYRGNVVTVVTQDAQEPSIRPIPGGYALILPQDWERGLLVGLEDSEGFLVSLAALKKVDLRNGRIVVSVPRSLANRQISEVRGIRVGSIRLGEDYSEVGKFSILTRVERILHASG